MFEYGSASKSETLRHYSLRAELLSELLASAKDFAPSTNARLALAAELHVIAAILEDRAVSAAVREDVARKGGAAMKARWAAMPAGEQRAEGKRRIAKVHAALTPETRRAAGKKGGSALWGKLSPQERKEKSAKQNAARWNTATPGQRRETGARLAAARAAKRAEAAATATDAAPQLPLAEG